MRWLYLYFPQLYLHSCGADPQQPHALLAARGEHLLDLNSCARQQGLESGMPLATAWCLCPTLQVQRLRPERQQHWLQQRALWAYQYSAHISLDPPEGLWLEVASMAKLFGSVTQLWQQLTDEASSMNWLLHSGVAATPLQAKLAAYNAWFSQPTTEHDVWQRCLQASITELLLPDEQQLQLQHLGIRTLQQLLRLPAADIASRLSPELLRYLQQLQGRQAMTLERFKPPLIFQDEVLFISEVEHRNGLLFPLTRMLASLSGFLWQRQLATRSVHVHLSHRHQASSHWPIEFAHAEYRQAELLFLCRHQLEQRQLSAPVTQLSLRVEQFVALHNQQPSLHSEAQQNVDQHLLLNRLQAKLGPQQVRRLHPDGDARPEYASCQPRQCDAGLAPLPNQYRRSLRPLWLLPQPLPCPTPPQCEHGPERISAGWWQHQSVRRDYYHAWLNGCYAWVFRDDQQQWFVHGYFS
jgi:protein ImuB